MTMIPQFEQFIGEAVIALGNRWPLQLFADPASAVNPAKVVSISTTAEGSTGTIATINTSASHGLTSSHVGGQVLIAGVLNSAFNGAFTILTVPSSTSVTVYNTAPAALATSSGGTLTVTSIPAISTFTPAFPTWSASTGVSQGTLIVPTVSNGHYYVAIQGGTTGTAEPTWTTATGSRVVETSPGDVVWQEAGLVNSAAPPPHGAGHIAIYAGSLWVFNTKPTDDTSTNIDGPCCLRMSDVNNPNSWNPINTAFIDKDDGAEGMGLASFTITAQGIPPEGSLVAFKNFVPYQILGVFGASNFAIQRVKSTMGCLAPRSILFVPGFGLVRWTHLGFAVFDGVDDRIISEEVRPYLFPENDNTLSDIAVMDASYQYSCWSGLTSQPAMYFCAIPIGASGGQLTRLMCYDLVLKAWAVVDLPFSISFCRTFASGVANPVPVLGGFLDGALQRWQSGDAKWWANGTSPATPTAVAWSVRTPELASGNNDQRIFVRRLMLRGNNDDSTVGITFSLSVNGQAETGSAIVQVAGRPSADPVGSALVAGTDFEAEFGVGVTGLRFHGTLSASGNVELFGFTWYVVPKTAGVRQTIT